MISSAPARPPRVVVTDDEEGLLFLMVDSLRREGMDVRGFESGREAFDYLSKAPADLLLLDLKLSDLPAPDLVEKLRSVGRDFPFLIITGHGDERTAVEVMKQGALDYIMKESGVLELLPGIVRRALGVIERERRLAEATEALRQREERQRKIIQAAVDGFICFDGRGTVLEVNNALCHLIGCSHDELIGSSVFAIKTSNPEEIQQQVSKLREQGSIHCFTRIIHDDGRQLEVALSLRSDGEEFFGFIHDVTEQRRLERQVLEVSEEERHRFGCELHDNLGQQLTALEMMSATLARELRNISPPHSKSASGIAEGARKMIALSRQLAHSLAPVALEEEGLSAALTDLARVTTATGVNCTLSTQGSAENLPLQTATHLYRIAQEAVSNALKHAHARKIALSLKETHGAIELTIEDDGKGLPINHHKKGGMGLSIIQHRSRLIGASLHLHSTRQKGLRIVCTLPTQS